MEKTLIIMKDPPEYEEWIGLVELMVYNKMSYPIGLHKTCEVYMNDRDSMIYTPDTIYKLPDLLYLKLHLVTNEIIANLYKTVQNDKEV